ncbi:hypothetical protein Ae201684P_003635 [Aphanomyces euteiches]|nr:hypothetical protein Ae201684P_003635 [Aphanomyces euteiches]
MMVIVLAALVVSSESVRSVLEETFAWFVQLLVDNTQEFFWGLLLLTCFCLLSYIMEPEKTKRSRPTAAANKPRWEVFRVTNYIVSAMFVVSLSLLLSHQNKREQQQHLMVFYIAACGCILSLTYFFAFFAVGFASNQVHDESSEDEKEDDKWKSSSPKACQPPIEKEVKMIQPLVDLSWRCMNWKRSFKTMNALCVSADFTLNNKTNSISRNCQLKDTTMASNCEVVVGYVPLPVGLAGPIKVNGENVFLPMATTEGCLIASTNRGCKVLNMGGGVDSIVLADSITRAPCVRFARAVDAAALKAYLDNKNNFEELAAEFNSTTRYGRMTAIKTVQSGRNCYVRIACNAGNAMGMNMVSKGTLAVLTFLKFPLMELVALSGNVCTDKKSAAINWLEGRGKSVVADAVVKADIVTKVLRTSVDALVDLNIQKNLIGSAMAGSLGGFNAQAANILTAIFLATGQDPAQNVESSSCMTTMEKTSDGDLYISVTMPSIEVGTVGGGTHLAPQKSCLGLMGCAPDQTHKEGSESGSRRLACAIAAGVMAGELSLLAALATNELVKSHMDLNRKK